MKKSKRILLYIIGILLLVMLIASFFANSFLEKKVTNLLNESLPAHIEHQFEDISVNVLRGRIALEQPTFTIKLIDTNLVQSKISMKSFSIGGIGYWDYLMNDEISIGKISFEEAKILHYKDRKNKAKDSTQEKKETKKPSSISVRKFVIENSSVQLIDQSKDSLSLAAENINIEFSKVQLDANTSLQTFQDSYKSMEISADSLFLKLGLYENLRIAHFAHADQEINIEGLELKTKYSKKELSRVISTERDHFNVKGASLQLNEVAYGFKDNSFYFSSSLLTIDETVAEIYRDKLVADDLKVKKLYSASIRELPIPLTIDSVSITNSSVIYEEKSHEERPPGVLTITSIQAGVSNVSNTYAAPEKTNILVDAVFMKSTPFHANWSFDVNNEQDEFEFIGDIGVIHGESLNTLLVPLINAKVEGEIDDTLFTIKGNNYQSMIYMSQKYEDVKIEILTKKKKKNVFVSGLANAFIHHKSSSEGKKYNHITTDAQRNNTKSFFNYLSINLKQALLVSFFEGKNKKYKIHKVHEEQRKYREVRLKKKAKNN